MDAPRLRTLRYFLGIGTAALAASIIVEASLLPEAPLLGMSERGSFVGLVAPGGPAERAGLRVGDEILSVNGQDVRRLPGPSLPLRSCRPSQWIEIEIERTGVAHSIVLIPDRSPHSEVAWSVARAAAALIALFVGSAVFMRRARQLTLVFFLICVALSMILFFPYVPPVTELMIAADLIRVLLNAFFPALFYHFFLLFPYERPILQRRPGLARSLYLVSLGLFLLNLSVILDLWPVGLLAPVRLVNEILLTAAFTVSFVASIWVFFRAFRRTDVPSIRRKLRVALWGTVAGVLPIAVVLFLHGIFPDRRVPFDRLAALGLVLVPIAFAYAIVKHGVFDIERIVKRSLAVTTVTAALILLYFLSYFLLRALLHSVTSLSGTLISVIAFLFVILLFSPIRTRIEDLVDRSIYPERFESRRRLREFARNLPSLRDENGIVRSSLETAAAALGIERGAFFPETAQSLEAGFTWGLPEHAPESLRLASMLREPIYKKGEPLLREEVESELPYGFMPEPENQTFVELEATLLVPIATRRRRFGVAVLGKRFDGDPFGTSDLDILESLATQTALAMENAGYQRELSTKEAIARELEVAKSVQRQLLPQSAPTIPGVEIRAVTLPCHEVGGDYFDYVQSDNGQLSLAVADVSGKGIPAALLMANVQALFRAEARSAVEPDVVLDRINRRLCETERPERFVSFFCALFDPEKRELRYSSAGHPPPLFVRFDGSLHHLDAAGLLLGIQPDATYPLGVVRLRAGDLILCYTDGIPDPFALDSTLREDQLEEMVRSLRNLPAQSLLDRILQRVQERPELEDDTTLLLFKMV